MIVEALSWGENFSKEREFDIVLAADCLYHPESQLALKETLMQVMTADRTECWLCFPHRSGQSLEFIEKEMEGSNEFELLLSDTIQDGLYIRGFKKA